MIQLKLSIALKLRNPASRAPHRIKAEPVLSFWDSTRFRPRFCWKQSHHLLNSKAALVLKGSPAVHRDSISRVRSPLQTELHLFAITHIWLQNPVTSPLGISCYFFNSKCLQLFDTSFYYVKRKKKCFQLNVDTNLSIRVLCFIVIERALLDRLAEVILVHARTGNMCDADRWGCS